MAQLNVPYDTPYHEFNLPDIMHIITTIGAENSTKAVLPFIAAKGAMSQGEKVSMFAMQEATYLGSKNHVDLSELKAPGLPTVREVLDELLANDALEEFIVCEPCAAARNISEADLAEWAVFGGAPHLVNQTRKHETSLTF